MHVTLIADVNNVHNCNINCKSLKHAIFKKQVAAKGKDLGILVCKQRVAFQA